MNTAMSLVLFNVLVIVMLVVDLRLIHRREHAIDMREGVFWSVIWVVIALLFDLGIYAREGSQKAAEFLTAYIIERALSIDNIFVFVLIFAYFGVPDRYQHKVLFWGIFGALVTRFVFIATGVTLIQTFHWAGYAFGAFLVVTSLKLPFEQEREIRPERNPIVRLVRRFLPIVDRYEGGRFVVRRDSVHVATLLFIVLIVIETTDVLFAVDSIPAILGITIDPFIVYSSNVFAILGLRHDARIPVP